MDWEVSGTKNGTPIEEIGQLGPPSGSFDKGQDPETVRERQYFDALDAAQVLARSIGGDRVQVEIKGTTNDPKKPDSVTLTVTAVKAKAV